MFLREKSVLKILTHWMMYVTVAFTTIKQFCYTTQCNIAPHFESLIKYSHSLKRWVCVFC